MKIFDNFYQEKDINIFIFQKNQIKKVKMNYFIIDFEIKNIKSKDIHIILSNVDSFTSFFKSKN